MVDGIGWFAQVLKSNRRCIDPPLLVFHMLEKMALEISKLNPNCFLTYVGYSLAHLISLTVQADEYPQQGWPKIFIQLVFLTGREIGGL
jgi:hypothetical protein